MISSDTANLCGMGPYSVTSVPNFNIPLADGCNLATKFWFPFTETPLHSADETIISCKSTANANLDAEVFPVILEYLPYRKDDITASRDYIRHTWFCSHGFVCARVDMRGTGNSQGLYFDEYAPQEQKDCLEVIDWLAKQPWSNGRVGMYGKSWGGFNGLQMAALRPVALKAVVSLYSTDDRYTDDIHYAGGCMMGADMLGWAATMFAKNAMPPTPKYYKNIGSWKEAWLERLKHASECWLKQWVSHQSRDQYWKHGSINEDYCAITCPVLIIGGLRDSYVSAAFRMAAELNEQCRAFIGPWAHEWPDCAKPGPNIDYLSRCLDWWSAYLKSNSQSEMEVKAWPRLQAYVRDSYPPKSQYDWLDGRWFAIPDWTKSYRDFKANAFENLAKNTVGLFLNADGQLDFEYETREKIFELPTANVFQGLWGGEFLSFGDADWPGCQSLANSHSLCWTTDPLETDIVICGFIKLMLSARAKSVGKESIIFARLCDIFPSGEATLITFGVQNFNCFGNSSEDSNDSLRNIELTFNATTYVQPQGHKLCLALQTSYFPIVLHAGDPLEIKLGPENSACLVLQALSKQVAAEIQLPSPKHLLPCPRKLLEYPSLSRTATVNLSDSQSRIEVIKMDYSGKYFYPHVGLTILSKETVKSENSFDCSKPKISALHHISMDYSVENLNIDIKTCSELVPDEKQYNLSNELCVKLNDSTFYSAKKCDNVPRN